MERVAVMLLVRVAMAERETLTVGVTLWEVGTGESDQAAVGEGVGESVSPCIVEDPEKDSTVGKLLAVGKALNEIVGVPLMLGVGDTVKDNVGVPLTLGVEVALEVQMGAKLMADLLATLVTVALLEPEGVGLEEEEGSMEPVVVGLVEAEYVDAGEGLTEEVDEGVPVKVGLLLDVEHTVGVVEAVPVTVPEFVWDAVGVAHEVGVRLDDTVTLGQAVVLTVGEGDLERDVREETVVLDVPVGDDVEDRDAVGESEG